MRPRRLTAVPMGAMGLLVAALPLGAGCSRRPAQAHAVEIPVALDSWKQLGQELGTGLGQGLTWTGRTLGRATGLGPSDPEPVVVEPPAPPPRTAEERRALRLRRELALFRATQQGPFDTLIADAAEKNGLDVFLFKGLLENESRFDPNLRSRIVVRVINGKKKIVSGGASGIAQFTPGGVSGVNDVRRLRARKGEAFERFTFEQTRDPAKAIPAAAELLSYYIQRFGRDGGVTAYNTGPVPAKAVARYGFYTARRMGLLCRVGDIHVQGERFLLNVLRKTNRLRATVGLPPLDPPRDRPRRIAEQEAAPAPSIPVLPAGGSPAVETNAASGG